MNTQANKKDGSQRNCGGRPLTVKLKTARGRKVSSQRWLMRQLNDDYVQKAKSMGYRSRAAFKLRELNAKHKFLKPGMNVVDLGAAPGGWSQVAAQIVQGGQVVAIDINPMDPLANVDICQLDFLNPQAPDIVKRRLKNGKVDVVLSDMAAPATGHPLTDHLRIMGLAEAAFDFAEEVLNPGGTFVAKVLQGGTEQTLLQQLKQRFKTVKHVKPPASRKDSAETYVVAMGFKDV